MEVSIDGGIEIVFKYKRHVEVGVSWLRIETVDWMLRKLQRRLWFHESLEISELHKSETL